MSSIGDSPPPSERGKPGKPPKKDATLERIQRLNAASELILSQPREISSPRALAKVHTFTVADQDLLKRYPRLREFIFRYNNPLLFADALQRAGYQGSKDAPLLYTHSEKEFLLAQARKLSADIDFKGLLEKYESDHHMQCVGQPDIERNPSAEYQRLLGISAGLQSFQDKLLASGLGDAIKLPLDPRAPLAEKDRVNRLILAAFCEVYSRSKQIPDDELACISSLTEPRIPPLDLRGSLVRIELKELYPMGIPPAV